MEPEGSCDCGRIVGPSIECGIIPEGKPVFVVLGRDQLAVDAELLRRVCPDLLG